MNYAFIILGVLFIFVLYYYLYSDGSTVLSNKLDLSIVQPAVRLRRLVLPIREDIQLRCGCMFIILTGLQNISYQEVPANQPKQVALITSESNLTLLLQNSPSSTRRRVLGTHPPHKHN